jgi:hypothetical protein
MVMTRLVPTKEYIEHVQSMEQKVPLSVFNKLEHRVRNLERKVENFSSQNKAKTVYLICTNDLVKTAVLTSKEDAQEVLITLSQEHCKQYSGMYESLESYWKVINWHIREVSVHE